MADINQTIVTIEITLSDIKTSVIRYKIDGTDYCIWGHGHTTLATTGSRYNLEYIWENL